MVVCAPWWPCTQSACWVGLSWPGAGEVGVLGGDTHTLATCQEERGWLQVALLPQEHKRVLRWPWVTLFRRLLRAASS